MKQTYWLQNRNAGVWIELTREHYIQVHKRLFTYYPNITEHDTEFQSGKWKGFVWPPVGSIPLPVADCVYCGSPIYLEESYIDEHAGEVAEAEKGGAA